LIIIATASALADVYGYCVSAMNENMGYSAALKNMKNIAYKNVKQAKDQVADVSKGIKSEQIKYRNFDNYKRNK
jgi:hypothetical protein